MSSKAVCGLRVELDRVRQSLRDTDDNIRKLTGRESFAENRFRQRDNFVGPPAKRQNVGGISSWAPRGNRLQSSNNALPDSGDEDEMAHKPVVQSSVVATQKDLKSRQDTIERQNSSEKDVARNRRMFGVLMGTLQQFRAEEKQKEQQDQKRKAVEQKLEEKQKEEKEMLKKEKQQLFVDRREKQMKMKQLENKIELAQLYEEWEEQTRTLMNFIRSNSKPYIFYLPKSHTDASLKSHEQSRAALEAIISERKRQLAEEIDEGAEQEHEIKFDDRKFKVKNHEKGLRSRKNNEDCEKMEVSDLEDDTGVNVDYGVSGDEQNSSVVKDAHQTSSRKSHRSSSHYMRDKESRQHSQHPLNVKETKVTPTNKQFPRSEELHLRDDDTKIIIRETDKAEDSFDHEDVNNVHTDSLHDSVAQSKESDDMKEMPIPADQDNQSSNTDHDDK